MKLSEMTPEQKRVKIAELCGWTGIVWNFLQNLGGSPPGGGSARVPDYLGSLDSIHGAMDSLTYEQAYDFCNHVDTITMRDRRAMDNRPPVKFCALCATAVQRADAFLLTMGVEP